VALISLTLSDPEGRIICFKRFYRPYTSEKNKSIKSIILTKLRDQKAGYTKYHVGAEELLKVTGSHVSLYIKRGKVAPYVTYVRNVGRGRLSSE